MGLNDNFGGKSTNIFPKINQHCQQVHPRHDEGGGGPVDDKRSQSLSPTRSGQAGRRMRPGIQWVHDREYTDSLLSYWYIDIFLKITKIIWCVDWTLEPHVHHIFCASRVPVHSSCSPDSIAIWWGIRSFIQGWAKITFPVSEKMRKSHFHRAWPGYRGRWFQPIPVLSAWSKEGGNKNKQIIFLLCIWST